MVGWNRITGQQNSYNILIVVHITFYHASHVQHQGRKVLLLLFAILTLCWAHLIHTCHYHLCSYSQRRNKLTVYTTLLACTRCAQWCRVHSDYGSTIVSRPSPFTGEEGSSQIRIAVLCCRVSSRQAVQGVTSNSMQTAVNCDIFLRHSGWTIQHTSYNATCNVVSMRARHEVQRA